MAEFNHDIFLNLSQKMDPLDFKAYVRLMLVNKDFNFIFFKNLHQNFILRSSVFNFVRPLTLYDVYKKPKIEKKQEIIDFWYAFYRVVTFDIMTYDLHKNEIYPPDNQAIESILTHQVRKYPSCSLFRFALALFYFRMSEICEPKEFFRRNNNRNPEYRGYAFYHAAMAAQGGCFNAELIRPWGDEFNDNYEPFKWLMDKLKTAGIIAPDFSSPNNTDTFLSHQTTVSKTKRIMFHRLCDPVCFPVLMEVFSHTALKSIDPIMQLSIQRYSKLVPGYFIDAEDLKRKLNMPDLTMEKFLSPLFWARVKKIVPTFKEPTQKLQDSAREQRHPWALQIIQKIQSHFLSQRSELEQLLHETIRFCPEEFEGFEEFEELQPNSEIWDKIINILSLNPLWIKYLKSHPAVLNSTISMINGRYIIGIMLCTMLDNIEMENHRCAKELKKKIFLEAELLQKEMDLIHDMNQKNFAQQQYKEKEESLSSLSSFTDSIDSEVPGKDFSWFLDDKNSAKNSAFAPDKKLELSIEDLIAENKLTLNSVDLPVTSTSLGNSRNLTLTNPIELIARKRIKELREPKSLPIYGSFWSTDRPVAADDNLLPPAKRPKLNPAANDQNTMQNGDVLDEVMAVDHQQSEPVFFN
jgi:hypothetical protein